MNDAERDGKAPDALARGEHLTHELRTLLWDPRLRSFVVRGEDRHPRQHFKQKWQLDRRKPPRNRRAIVRCKGMLEHGANQDAATLVDIETPGLDQRLFRLVDRVMLVSLNQLNNAPGIRCLRCCCWQYCCYA